MGGKKSYQFRALTRKTLSYQKRQKCTNICCVGCCPFLMVAICGILTFVVNFLVGNLVTTEYYTFCANANATNFYTGLPSSAVNTTFYDGSTAQERQQVNVNPDGPCMQWFGPDAVFSYPYTPGPTVNNCSALYNPALCPLASTASAPTPLEGWLPDPVAAPTTAGEAFVSLFVNQYNFWGFVSAPAGVDVGVKTAGSSQRLFPPFGSATSGQSSGLLGNFTDVWYTPDSFQEFNATTIRFQPRPYYEYVLTQGDFSEVQTQLINLLNNITADFQALPPPRDNASSAQIWNYTLAIQELIRQVPLGALLIEDISPGAFNYTLQIGTNRQVAYMSVDPDAEGQNVTDSPVAFPGFWTEGLRRIYQQTKLAQALLKSTAAYAGYSLTQGLRMFPENETNVADESIGGFVGQILYPFGVSFLLPVFVVSIVKEKEDRILVMMRMNGMKTWVYWLSEYIHFYILHIFASGVFIATGWIFRLQFFTLTDPGAYILLFFLWGHTQIAMAFLLSAFFNRSRIALMLVFCLVLAGVIINVSLAFLFGGPAPYAYLLYPPFAFYRALTVMNNRASDVSQVDYKMYMMVPGDEVFNCVMALIVETVFVFLVAAYILAVLPSEYGISRPWHFIFTEPLEWYRQRQPQYKALAQKQKEEAPQQVQVAMPDEPAADDADHYGEDEDVPAERARVLTNGYALDCPVIIKDMRKVYPNGKLAVKSVSLAIDKNTVFGLLGPNGAGKTSLISILTGLYPPTSGDAFLAGLNVNTQMKDIYMNIGVCPQHDILWDDLTVEEHLLFYARIKGVSPRDEKASVAAALGTVSLTKFKDRLSKALSGGEKRRLSIAISLIGDGQVVFLDEPTTGLDPEVRRLIWDIINKAKAGRTIILTTHSMEEAEVLCQRIGIMAKGTLRCLGTQIHLKNKYGSGFKVSASCEPHNTERASRYIESLLPPGRRKLDNFVGNFSYEFQAAEISSLIREIGAHKDEYGIQFWGFSQTTLEEVFLHIIGEVDAEAT